MEDNQRTSIQLRIIHTLELRGKERLHLVVLVGLYGALEGGDVGMRRSRDDGNLLTAIYHLDGNGATVVAQRTFVGTSRQCYFIMLQTYLFGFEYHLFGKYLVLFLERHLFLKHRLAR